jgi:putative acetyltransferase
MEIVLDDLSGEEIAQFLAQHMEDMRSVSPPESVYALDLDGLRQPEITFWSARIDGKLVGCGALKELDAQHGELKSMRADAASRGRGIASGMLKHILQVAKARGYDRVSLETGPMDFFAPAFCSADTPL